MRRCHTEFVETIFRAAWQAARKIVSTNSVWHRQKCLASRFHAPAEYRLHILLVCPTIEGAVKALSEGRNYFVKGVIDECGSLLQFCRGRRVLFQK
jgi:hypothetical protein